MPQIHGTAHAQRGLRGGTRAALGARDRGRDPRGAGASNREIARDLRISEATVKTHLIHIFEKLGVGDRTSAVASALERGLIELPRT